MSVLEPGGVSVPDGWRLFARYAYAPNARGYCGPPGASVLADVARGGGQGVDVPGLARKFSGAWPYHVLIAELAGIEDPLDARVGRAYWTGSDLTAEIDADALGRLLLERFAAQAGHYWSHLTEDLLAELSPTHAFHVLGVYPWSRLLDRGRPEPLEVIDSCRIRWGEVVERQDDQLLVNAQELSWDGRQLSLAPPRQELIGFWPAGPLDGGGRSDEPDPQPGQTVAIHWRHACDVLTAEQAAQLERWTVHQVECTNRRLG